MSTKSPREFSHEELVAIFKQAEEENKKAADATDDMGTCNLDSVVIDWDKKFGNLTKKVEEFIEKAAREAGLSSTAVKYKFGRWIHIHFTPFGQANKRTMGIQAANRVLKHYDLSSRVFYVID